MSHNNAQTGFRRIREWKSLDRIRAKLIPQHRDTAMGVLMIGPAAAAERKALEVAREQSADPLIVRPPGRAVVPTLDRIRALVKPDPQLTLGAERSFPVVVILGLDECPARLHDCLKGWLERPVLPWLCIATCETVEPIPDYLASMFYLSKALEIGGRPRKRDQQT